MRKKAWILAAALILALALYGAARYHAPALMRHVVEQSLIQKAPAEIETATVRQRLQACLAAEPDADARMRKLLQISAYLEKIQRLTPEEWNELLPPDESR